MKTNYGKWTLGFNLGGTCITGDVKSKVGTGWGFYLGHQIYYKPYRILRVDLQGRILGSRTRGLSQNFSSSAGLNPALNGTYSPTLNYTGVDILHNYRVKGTEYSLELVLSANRLRERTKFILQGFAGIGAYYYKVDIDQLDEFGNMYDYSTNFNRDFVYESSAYNSRNWRSHFVPTLGYGFGYQLRPSTALLFEHKLTFPLHSDLDGNPYEERSWFYPNDIQHYLGFSLRFNFGRGTTSKTTPQPNPGTTSTPKPTPVPTPTPVEPMRLAPVVNVTNPPQNSVSTFNPTYLIVANISNVNDRNGIQFRVNGIQNTSFTYNTTSGRFQSQVTLSEGVNSIRIIGSNEIGTDSKRVFIEKKTKTNPPIITFINPTGMGSETTVPTYKYKVKIDRVSSRNQLQVQHNGVNVTNYLFNPQTGILDYTGTLQKGINTLFVSAQNDGGNASRSGTVKYTSPIVTVGRPPLVNTLFPIGSPYISTTCKEQVRVSVTGVSNKSQIQIQVGQAVLNSQYWTYTNGVVEFQAVVANEDKYTILATTPDGSASDEVHIKCQKEIVICHQLPEGTGQQTMTIPQSQWPLHQTHGDQLGACTQVLPEIIRTIPVSSPFTSKNCVANAQLTTKNIAKRSELIITKNGQPFYNWTFSNSVIAWNETIKGKTTYVVKATTAGGTTSEIVTFNCEPKIQICHVKPEGTGRETITIPESQWSLHQAHGDVLGACSFPKPTLKRTKPNVSPYTTSSGIATVQIKTTEITNKNQITIRKNGITFTGFSFSNNAINWSENIYLPTTYVITASNDGGSVTETVIIQPEEKVTVCHHERGKPNQTLEIPKGQLSQHLAHGDTKGRCLDKPVAKIITPTNGLKINTNRVNFVGTVTGATSKQRITLTVNGVSTPFNYLNDKVTANFVVKEGTNKIVLKATGSDGVSTKSVSVSYTKPVKVTTTPKTGTGKTKTTPPKKGGRP